MHGRERVCLLLAVCLLLSFVAPASAKPLSTAAMSGVAPQAIDGDEWDYGTASDDSPATAQDIQALIPGNGRDQLWQKHNFDNIALMTADHDWFRFQVTAADITARTTFLFEADTDTDTVDPVIEVYGPDDNSPSFPYADPAALPGGWDQTNAKAGNDDFQTNTSASSRLAFTPAATAGCAPGFYYIRVRPYSNNRYFWYPGDYTFTAKRGGFERLGGANRFETAARVSQERFNTRRVDDWRPGAVLVNAWNYPDALAGASLAGYLNAPILLSNRLDVPIPTDDELSRLLPEKTYALGGDSNIADSLMPSYEGIVAPGSLYGLYGSGRVQTAVQVANAIKNNGGTLSGLAFVVNGWAWPDALAATPVSSRGPSYSPIFLTHKDYCDTDTLAAIQSLGITDVVIIGSENVVSPAAYWQIVDALGMDESRVLRLGGADRYETAMKVALWSTDHFGPGTLGDGRIGTQGSPAKLADLPRDDYLCVATGENFPDALGAGVYAGHVGMPLMLTPKASLSKRILDTSTSPMQNYVHSVGKVEQGFVFGSESAVSYNTMLTLDTKVSGQDYTP